MKEDKNYYIVDKAVLPEIFLKVMDVKNLLESKKEKTVQDAVNRVGISRSAFYNYRDAVHPLYENTRGKTVTISMNLDHTRGLLSSVLNSIASEGASILTINQTIPINNIANVTVTIETNEMQGELGRLMTRIEGLAASLNADMCEIYTDVEGVYTADPRVVPDAVKLDEISYDEMLELASLGAKVLHSRSVEVAKKYNVKLVVRSSMSEAEGTEVKEDVKMERMLVSGVAADKKVSRISIMGINDEPGKAFEVFSLMAKEKVSVDIILQSTGADGKQNISFTIGEDDLDIALKALE